MQNEGLHVGRIVRASALVSDLFERRFGPHFLRSESNNTYHLVFDGDVTGQQLAELFSTRSPDLDPNTCTLMFVDVRRIGSVRPTLTPGHSLWDPKETTFIAYVGATFTLRMTINMFLGAAQLLGRRKWIVNAFFDDETNARDWLAEMRRKYLAEKETRKSGKQGGEGMGRERRSSMPGGG